jgi:hypothetical protein
MPVSVFLIKTVAPGIAALLISTTVPVMVPVPEVCAVDKAALRHRTRRGARERKKEDRLGRRVEKFSFMVTASKNPYGVWPADAIDKRHDGWVGISALEIPRPFIHGVPTAVLCQEIKTVKVSARSRTNPR